MSVTNKNLRHSGIDIIENMSWGTHFCQFYQTKEDLIDILVPYFKAGLENNEFCMWITSQPLEIEAAKEALGKAVPDINVYLDQGQLEIISYFHWYVNDGAFDSNRVLNGWVEKLNKALANGYDGLRLTGNTFWLAKEDWEDFVDYEKDIDRVLGNYQMIALCTYNFDRCNSTETIDVVSNHKFALIKKKGEWEQIESSKLKRAEKVEEVLRLSNLYNRSLIEASLDPLVTIGPDGKITDVNEATEQVTGYSRDELIGTDFSDYFTEPKKAKKGYQEVFSVGFVYDYELAIQNKNGHITPVLYNASVYEDESGKVFGVFAAARDITESKKAEEALREAYEHIQVQSEEIQVQNEELQAQSEELRVQNEELQVQSEEIRAQNEELQVQSEELKDSHELLRETEERFRTLTENSPDIIARFDRQNRHTYINPAAVKLYECSQEEIIGKTNTELGIDPKLIKFWEGHYENVFTTAKPETMEFHYKSSQGKDYYFNTRIVPELIKSRVVSVLAVFRDITDIKKAEEALRLSNIYNRSLIEASLDPLVTIGLDGKITDVNIATEQITGYHRKELIGTDFSAYFTESSVASTGYQHVFRHGEVRDYSLEIQHKDGHITPVLYNASVYKDESGKVIGVFAAARDITERKKAENILKLKLEELARSNEELEQFAYVSSHDLQEPLRMITSYLQLLQKKYQGNLDDKADKYIHFAVDGASRIQNLINDLLAYSRVTRDAREPEFISCKSILNQTLSNLKVILQEKKVTISYGTLPDVMVNSTQIIQVFQNLISN